MLMVLGCHVNHGARYFDRVNPTGCVITNLVADGVAIFWLIMGFFLFKSDYRHVLKRSVHKILIPMFVFSIVMFYLGEFLCGDSSDILFGFKRPLSDYKEVIFNGLLKWRTRISYTSHFWYLYSYMIVVLAFPALNGIQSFVKSKRDKLILLSVLLGILILNDIGMNELVGFSNRPFYGALGGSFLALIGYIIYTFKDKYEGKVYLGILGLVAYFIINAVRSVILYKMLLQDGSNHVIYWYTSFGVLSGISLTVFVFGIKRLLQKKIVKKTVLHLGKLTMGIYVVHLLALAKLRTTGVYDYFENSLRDSPFTILLVQLGKTLSLLILSLIIVEVYYWITAAIRRGIKHG